MLLKTEITLTPISSGSKIEYKNHIAKPEAERVMKHQLIEERIREMILSAEAVDEKGQLISERLLAEKFGTSRTTIRKAINSLQNQGVLISMHGKGTFVKNIKDLRYSQSLYSVTKCAQYYREQNMEPIIDVLSRDIVEANMLIASYLKIEKGAPVLKVRKLFRANRYIFNLTDSYIPLEPFPNLKTCDFTNPICEVLRAKYGAVPRRTENTIEAILPPTDVSEVLNILSSTPILLFEAITTGIVCGKMMPLEYYKTYHRTDSLRFSFVQEHEAVE